MSKTAVLHSKTLQLSLGQHNLVFLALEGTSVFPVRDLKGGRFGTVEITISALARAAILEHIDETVPPDLLEAALAERGE